jgi:hypothetical protein
MAKKRRAIPGPPGACGKAHISALKADSRQPQLYAAFSAAYDGCVVCVRQALDAGAVEVNQQSDNSTFNLMEWAVWGHQDAGNDTDAVQQLLRQLGASRHRNGKSVETGSAERTLAFVQEKSRVEQSTVVEQSTANGSIDTGRIGGPEEMCTQSHRRVCDADHTGQPYQFFSAAFAGCARCVRQYIEEGGDPAVQTRPKTRSALEWARVGKEEGRDTDWVIGFLEGKALKRKLKEQTDNFQEPLEGWQAIDIYGPGAKMVLRPPLTHMPRGVRLGKADRRGVGWG